MSDAGSLTCGAEAQRADTEAYRRSPYPIALHPTTHPDRLAAIATLAGLNPPDVRTARVLEVGCGNAVNLLAMAAAYPEARFVGIDIVADAIEQGQRWATAAGLDNVSLTVADLVDPDVVEGPFDYIIAHGLFAWVPEGVADALLALIGHHLAANGVAFLSYNALPAGYIRIALREAMLHAIGDEDDPERRMQLARAMLARIDTADPDDNPIQQVFRYHARLTASRTDNVLLHDELGGNFRPRYVGDVITEAAAHGLAFLGDSRRLQLGDGFLPDDVEPDDDPDTQVIDRVIERDWIDAQSFRSSLFVRAGNPPRRTLDVDAIDRLFVSSVSRVEGDARVVFGGQGYDIVDAALMAALRRVIAAYPQRVAVRDLALAAAQRRALFDLFNLGIVTLHAAPTPFTLEVGGRPVTSPLVRAMLMDNLPWVATLNHAALDLKEGAREMLLALDGTGDAAALDAAAGRAGLDTPDALTGGIAALVQLAVFVR